MLVGRSPRVAIREEEYPAHVVDFNRPRARNHKFDCVAVIKNDDLMIGFTGHMTVRAMKGFYNVSGPQLRSTRYIVTFNKNSTPENWKFFPGHSAPDKVLLLDQTLNINDRVNSFVNQNERGPEEAQCIPSGGRTGVVTKITQYADVRILNDNGTVIENVDITGLKPVTSINSPWINKQIIYKKRKGLVVDCVFEVNLRDSEDRRLVVSASCSPVSANGIFLHEKDKDGYGKLFVPGDKVFIREKGFNQTHVRWIDDRPDGVVETKVEFIIEKMEMIQLEVQFFDRSANNYYDCPVSVSAFEPDAASMEFSSVAELNMELMDTLAVITQKKEELQELNDQVAKEEKNEEEEEKIITPSKKIITLSTSEDSTPPNEETQQQTDEMISSGLEMVDAVTDTLDSIKDKLDSVMYKEKPMPDKLAHVIPTTPIIGEELKKVHFLHHPREEANIRGTDRVEVVLNGNYVTCSLDTYMNRLVRELKPFFSDNAFHFYTNDQFLPISKVEFNNETHIVEVIRRYSIVDVRWHDGEVETDIPSVRLNIARSLAHPTEIKVSPGMLATRPELKSNQAPDDEFGVVTIVNEAERTINVRWFKRKTYRKDRSAFRFHGAEELCIFDFVRHKYARYPLGTYVCLLRKGKDEHVLSDTVCQVKSNSDDGYQIVQFLDGEERQLWPGEGKPLSGSICPLDPAALEFEAYEDYDEPYYEDEFFDYEDYGEYQEEEEYSSAGSMISTPASSSAYFAVATSANGTLAPPVFVEKTASDSSKKKIGFSATVRKMSAECSGDCQYFFESLTTAKAIGSNDGIRTLAALLLATFPDTPCKYAAHNFASKDELLTSEILQDAKQYIFLTFKERSEEEVAELGALTEKHPDWKENLDSIFAIDETCCMSKLAVSAHRHFSLRRRKTKLTGRGTSHMIRAAILVAFPIPNDEAKKATLDAAAKPSSREKTMAMFEWLGGMGGSDTQLSYFSKDPFNSIRIPDDQRVYVAHFSQLFDATDSQRSIAKILPKGAIVVPISEAKQLDAIMTAQYELQGLKQHFEVAKDEERSKEVKFWDEALQRTELYSNSDYAYMMRTEKDIEAHKIKGIDFDFHFLAEKMGFCHDDMFEKMPLVNDIKAIEELFLDGSLAIPDIVPKCFKLDVGADCSPADVSDSFLAFHIMSQILSSPTWPMCTLTIHKHLHADKTLEQNFAKALIILRHTGIISGPFFNYVEVLRRTRQASAQYKAGKGELFEKFGLDVLKIITPLLKRLISKGVIRMWMRLNVVEKHFPLKDLVSNVKKVLASPKDAPNGLLPLVKVEDNLDSITDSSLRDEIRMFLPTTSRNSTVPSPSVPTGSFEILEEAVSTHKYLSKPKKEGNRRFNAAVRREHKLLANDLPEGIHVVTYEDRLDLLRAVIVGPRDTPYEDAPLIFDIYLPDTYPAIPPEVHYLSYTRKAINPNLYTCGKVCVSLLGTWSGQNHTQMWDPVKSNLLQVVCSIHTIILMTDTPYYNEPGFEKYMGTDEGAKAAENYNCQVVTGCMEYLVELMKKPPVDCVKILKTHFASIVPQIMERMKGWLKEENPNKPAFPMRMDRGMCASVRRSLAAVEKALNAMDEQMMDIGEANEPGRKELPVSEPTVDASNEKRTLFSEGDPMHESAVNNTYFVLRNM